MLNESEPAVWCIRRFVDLLFMSFLLIPFLSFGQEQGKIRPGDALQVIVHNNEALSQSVVVSPAGTVDFPFMQDLPVAGMSLARVHEILMAQLSRYLDKSPLITVRFAATYPVQITVLGQVVRPGVYQVANTSSLPGAIGQAGGFVPGAQLSRIKLIRKRAIDARQLDNGTYDDSVNVVNMEKFYLDGDPHALPAIMDGDLIIIPGNPLANSVKVLGSVIRPGSYEVVFQASLLDVLFLAGGPSQEANLNGIRVLTPGGARARETRVSMRNLLSSKNLSSFPAVAPGDVVYVPERPVTWKKFIAVVRDVTIVASLYFLISYGSYGGR